MVGGLHHVVVLVTDMERSLHLFRDLLGLDLVWGVGRVGGRKMSALVGIPELEAEMAYLRNGPSGVAVELVHVVKPPMSQDPVHSTQPGRVSLSLAVDNLDELHNRLTEEGWPPFTPCMDIVNPEGKSVRVFCFRTEDGLTLELIEDSTQTERNNP
jgi:catechol 2,3-dioxygenase-like lactoylglutathione lyase family enzyme